MFPAGAPHASGLFVRGRGTGGIFGVNLQAHLALARMVEPTKLCRKSTKAIPRRCQDGRTVKTHEGAVDFKPSGSIPSFFVASWLCALENSDRIYHVL